MLKPTRTKFAFYFHLFGMFLLAVSLPYSNFLMSLSLIILFSSWLLGGELKDKLIRFSKNKTALVISSIFILHLAGLIYTSDFNYGLEDVKKKIPLLLLPLIFSTSTTLSRNIFEKILMLFTASVISATLICFFILLGYADEQILQPQQSSIFISHIRFGLLISMSVFILGYFVVTKKSILLKLFIPVLIIWLILFLIMMESATGLICTAVISVLVIVRFIFFTKKIVLRFFLLTLLMSGCIFSMMAISSITNSINRPAATSKKDLPQLTKYGNPYMHDTANLEIENRKYVWLNVCEIELSEEWNKKSSIDYYGKDLRGNEIKYTLIRFLTSKGLNKDADGINALSENEVKEIERGIPNINYTGIFNPTARIQKIIWELNTYKSGGNPSGHSVVQRLEFWKAAIGIIKENFLFGVGTGDVKNAFEYQYEKINSPLTKNWRLRSHNQFLAMGTAFGVIGIFVFVITLFYPVIAEKKINDYLYMAFFCITFLSMLTEDTLESQAGVTFFAFFNSLFLFCRKKSIVRTES